MKKLLAKIERIRSRGWVVLDLDKNHTLYHLDGKRFQIESIGVPDIKCKVSILVNGEKVDLTIDDLY
ncbi:hypothetical protein ACTJKN_07480 [Pedobacter sp. 22163]|uniref:hypothetical protein n=1 Tax=Pedobacter sp. 22163 TaxID=3453883 RepID=UPI003F872A4C